jgi:DNA-binding MarR family transcriptional regulator
MAALADALGVTPATATRMCDRLVRKKLIVRRSERGDRRQVRLELSKTGLELVAVVTARRRLEIERIVGTVPEEERDILIHALKLFASAAGEVPEQDWSTGWDL